MKTRGDFVRWGNLSPQDHKISEDRSYHTPPVKKGFYAFPRGFVERFLLGGAGSGSLQNGRFSKFKDKNGKIYKTKGSDFEDFKKKFAKDISKRLRLFYPEYDDWFEAQGDGEDFYYENTSWEKYENEINEGIWEVWIENKPTHFSYGGPIWHHLFNKETPQLDKEYPGYLRIIDSWVLTDMPTYLRCLDSECGRGKWEAAFARYLDSDDNSGKRKYRKQSPGFNYGGSPYIFSKDHFEVYIESIQNDNKR